MINEIIRDIHSVPMAKSKTRRILKALLESLISDLEGEKKRGKYRAKYCSQCGEEIGYDRANKEYFCGTCPFRSSESKEDLTQSQGDWNQALNLAQERIRGKLIK